jgi:hypothetical protein
MTDESKQQPQELGFAAATPGVMRPAGVVRSSAPAAAYPVRLTVDLSPEAANLFNQIMTQTGDSPSDLVRKALALYKVAVDAHGEGKFVGIAQTADSLETELVGF